MSGIKRQEVFTMEKQSSVILVGLIACLVLFSPVPISSDTGKETLRDSIYSVKKIKPVDSVLKVKVGDRAPDFTLPSVDGEKVSLKDFLGKKNIVLAFVPAAFTPVCSDQWPGYNIAEEIFEKNNTMLLGITVDNIPSLYAWTKMMGKLWFPVLSDFWPHGAVAEKYGVLRSDGVTERALFLIDKEGIIRYIDVHDINERPRLEVLAQEMEKLGQ